METHTAGSASGLRKRSDGNIGTAPQADSTTRSPDTVARTRACADSSRDTGRMSTGGVLTTEPIGSAISTCSETDCGRPHYARGLCNNCYRKVQRRGGFDKHPRAKTAPAMRGLISTLRAKVRRRNRAPLASSP